MVVKQINRTRKDKGTLCEMLFDTGEVAYLNIEVIIKNAIVVNTEMTFEQLQEYQNQSNKILAFNKCLNLLSRGMKTKKQLCTYLFQKGFNQIVTQSCIDKLCEYNYLNDELYAKCYIEQVASKKGIKAIKYDLMQKGVSQSIIDDLLISKQDDISVIQTLASKYLHNKEKTFKTKQKVFTFLVSKGFDFEKINNVLKEYEWSCNNEDRL